MGGSVYRFVPERPLWNQHCGFNLQRSRFCLSVGRLRFPHPQHHPNHIQSTVSGNGGWISLDSFPSWRFRLHASCSDRV